MSAARQIEYEKTGRIPRMRTGGREPFDSSWKNYGLSGKAGYLRYRKIYGGWDSELLSAAPAAPADGMLAQMPLEEDGGRSVA